MDDSEISSMLVEMRPALVADGADLELAGIVGGLVTIRLVLTESACAECLVPRAAFERMLLDRLRERMPRVAGVHVIDPRESPTAVASDEGMRDG